MPRKLAFSLLLAILVLFAVMAGAQAQGGGGQTTDADAQCLACHGIKGREYTLPSGETLSLYVDAETSHNSVHGQKGIPCTGCHTNITGYPHPAFTAQTQRDFQLQMYETCRQCHDEQYQATLDSMHTKALAGGNRNAAICTDCHGSHDITAPNVPREKISLTCSKCHSAIFEEYKDSVHGAALMEDGNPDVPTCIDCHGVHSISDPTTAQFRLKSPEVCGKCHRDAAIMSKYGISTDVFNTYVADFHGTTVTIFERQSPDQATNKAVCFDCHGVHNIKAVNDPEASVVKENLLVTCRKCHPDADTNFPASWTSHYIPDTKHEPLVYYVNLFYTLLIPGVIGFMIAFVSLDALHRIWLRVRGRFSKEAAHE